MTFGRSKRLEPGILWGLILIDLLFLTMAITFTVASHTYFEDRLEATTHNLVSLLEHNIADEIRLIDNAVERVVLEMNRQMNMGWVDGERLGQLLASEEGQLPEINAIRITDATGDVLWGKGVDQGAPASYADRDFFKHHREHTRSDLVITEPIKGKVSGLWVIAFTRCYQTAQGQFAGVVSAAVPVDSFSNLLASLDVGKTGTVVLRYADMGLIARVPPIEGPAGQPGHKVVSREFREMIESGQPAGSFHTTRSPDSVERTYAFRRVSGYPFTIAVGLVEAEFMAPWKMQVLWAGSMCLAFLLVTSVFGWMVLRHLRERTAAEEALRLQEERLRTAMEATKQGWFDLNVQTGEVTVSPEYVRIIGHAPAEFNTNLQNWLDSIHPEDRPAVLQAYRECLETAETGTMEYRRQANSGEWKWIRSVARIVGFDARNKPLRMTGTHADISDIKQAEAALQESEALYRTLLDTSPDAIIVMDTRVILTFVSRNALKLFGYSGDRDVIGRSALDWILPEEHEKALSNIGYILREGAFKDREYTLLKGDGTRFIGEVNAAPLPPADGNPTGTLLVIRDVTERKNAEQALIDSENRFKSFAEQALVGIYLVRDGIFAYVNPRFAEMFGYTVEECLNNLQYRQLVHPEDLAKVDQQIEIRRTAGVKFVHYTFKGLKKNGDPIDLEVYASSRDGVDRSGAAGTILDITDRKRVEEALRQSERSYREIFNTANDAIFVHDAKTGAILDVNDSMLELYGYTREEARHLSVNDTSLGAGPYSEVEVRQWMARTLTEGPQVFEWHARKKSGELFWVEVALKGADITGHHRLLAVVRDITDRKQAETATREAYTLLQNTFEAIPDLLSVHDRDLRVVLSNWHGADYIPEEERAARPYCYACYMRREAPCEPCPTREVFRTGQAVKIEVTNPYTGRISEVSAFPVRDASGAFQLVSEHVRDITDRRLMEKELRDALLFNKHIIDSAQEGIIVFDRDLRYQLWNPFMERLSGLKASYVMGKTPQELFPFMVESGVIEDLQRVLNGHTVEPREFQDEVPHTGRSGWVVQANAPLLNTQDEIIGVLGMVRDITEQKKTAEQLHQAQKMESVGRLAGGVAHDFNNMLSVILGHTEMALERLDPVQPMFEDLKEIEKAARRSADLVRQLLAFARQQTIAPRVIDLNEMVEGMLKLLRRLIGEDIDLAWHPRRDLWPLKIDPSQIDQILANLCVNARDAIAGVGRVTIETENVSFDEAYSSRHLGFVPGDYVLLAVSDNGCGMGKETLGKIFEPFFTTKGLGKGTGLGLSTVYGIAQQNAGFINVYSEPGEGTTFKIYLPRHGETESMESRKDSATGETQGPRTILLVEDEASILAMTARMVEHLGHTVLAASGPKEALRLAEAYQGEIHLLMTDVVMPEMNGRELAGHVLSFYPNIKTLFMSGYTANVIAHHGVLDKGVHFIQKPFFTRDLTARLREALGE